MSVYSRVATGSAEVLAERQRVAVRKAVGALDAVGKLGFRVWVVGSLAKGRFNVHSDIDFVVDCPTNREYDAFRAIERIMGDFPFHMVPFQRLEQDAIPFMMEGALDASGILSRQT